MSAPRWRARIDLPAAPQSAAMVAMRLWAAIFDWDGVILDSSSHHEEAWHRMAAEAGRPVPPGFFRKSFGMKNDRVIPDLLGWTNDPEEIRRISRRKEELFRELAARSEAAPLPGVVAWLRQLARAGVPCAIASSTLRENIECVIAALGVKPFFAAWVTAEDVTRGKPHPEVFLRAAAKLDTPPGRCVVFEDAHVGVEAGLAAGMKVVAVATTHPAASLQTAHRVVHRLDELQLAEIEAWFPPAPGEDGASPRHCQNPRVPTGLGHD